MHVPLKSTYYLLVFSMKIIQKFYGPTHLVKLFAMYFMNGIIMSDRQRGSNSEVDLLKGQISKKNTHSII